MIICEMCGEDIDSQICPFCKTRQGTEPEAVSPKKKALKVVNIKDDLPIVDTAIIRLEQQLATTRTAGYRAMKIIHGYGSTGKGGAIKSEVHRVLRRWYLNDEIDDWLPGEEFSAEYGETLEILKRNAYLESDEDFRKGNRGISIIII